MFELNEYIKKLKKSKYKKVELLIPLESEGSPQSSNDNVVVTFNYKQYPFKKKGKMNKSLIEARGIVFDKKTGKLLGLGIHKFFNNREVKGQNIEAFGNDYVMLEKVDGSMIIPFIFGDKVYFKTRRALCTVYKDGYVVKMTASNKKYEDSEKDYKKERVLIEKFIRACSSEGLCPLFEYSGPLNKICVDYKEETLRVVAIRMLKNGNYLNIYKAHAMCEKFGILHGKVFKAGEKKIEELMTKKNFEGLVLFYEKTQKFLKYKTKWYASKHKFFGKVFNTTKLFEIVTTGKLDDAFSYFNESQKKEALEMVKDLKDMSLVKKTDAKIRRVAEGYYKKVCEFIERWKDIGNREFSTILPKNPIELLFFRARYGRILMDKETGKLTKKDCIFIYNIVTKNESVFDTILEILVGSG